MLSILLYGRARFRDLVSTGYLADSSICRSFHSISDLESSDDIEQSVRQIISPRSRSPKFICSHLCQGGFGNISHVAGNAFVLELLVELLCVETKTLRCPDWLDLNSLARRQ